MIYCDTSLLLALYVQVDAFHAPARQVAFLFKEPIPLTLLSELELENGLHRSLGAGTISRQEYDAILRQIADDESQGLFVRVNLPPVDHFSAARSLSKKFTPQYLSRSLDILHVAAALLLKAPTFASFDLRQRQLAVAAGLKIAPRQLVRAQAPK